MFWELYDVGSQVEMGVVFVTLKVGRPSLNGSINTLHTPSQKWAKLLCPCSMNWFKALKIDFTSTY